MLHTQKTFDVFRTNGGPDILAQFLGQVDGHNARHALWIAARIYHQLPNTELWVDEADVRIDDLVDWPCRLETADSLVSHCPP